MSLILKSSSETALQKAMLKNIESQLKDIRGGQQGCRRILIIVPAQSTLQTEKLLFEHFNEKGFFDLHVLSGAKLRSDVLKECGKADKIAINTLGRRMLLRKIASDHKKELSCFSSVCKEDGFLDLAADLIVQLKQNKIDPVGLAEIAENQKENSILASKLTDMQLLYSEYQLAMAGKYTDSEDLLSYTASKLKDSQYIKESIIWYWGFYSFTKNEIEFLNALKASCFDFNIAILAGSDEYLAGEKTARALSGSLGLKESIIEVNQEASTITVTKCVSPYTQGYSIANDILKTHREKGFSYDEMLVLCQDMEGMGQCIKRACESFEIPVFMDEKRSLSHSQLAIVSDAILSIAEEGFKRRDVLSLIKSGIFSGDTELIEDFENYLKQYKIFESNFVKPFKYGRETLGDELDKLEAVRATIVNTINPFISEFSLKETVKEKAECFFDFLSSELKLPDYLQQLSASLEAAGFLEAAQEYSQSWDMLCEILDQMVELLGDEKQDVAEFASIVKSSFADIKVGVLPLSEGKITIGSVTRTSFSNIKKLYIAGFNDGIIPSEGSLNAMLTEDELNKLSDMGIEPMKNSAQLSLEELFQINRALNCQCQEMNIYYSLSDSEGNALRPSSLLEDLKAKHKTLEEQEDSNQNPGLLQYIQSSNSVSQMLPLLVKKLSLGDEIPEDWKLAYNISKENTNPIDKLSGVFFKPCQKNLDSDLAQQLFKKGSNDYYSPTQLEQYSLCPFKHFVNYGLRAKEFREFDVGSREAGTIYHFVLMEISARLTKKCNEQGIEMTAPDSPWMTIGDEEIKAMVWDILSQQKQTMMDGLMDFDSTTEYRVERIARVCESFAKYMILQVRKGDISSMFFETPFKDGETFPAVKVKTSFGNAVIQGQIDRVDIIGHGDDRFVKVIDYKSGTKKFNKDKIEAGLDLQLMIYLEGALGSDSNLKPGGVFYYAVKDPENEKDYFDVIADSISEDMLEKLASQYSLDGVAVNEDSVLKAIDKKIDESGKLSTDVFNLKSRSSYAGLISAEDMEKLRLNVKALLENICQKLKEGNAEIKPAYFKKENVACNFCNYKTVCMFALRK